MTIGNNLTEFNGKPVEDFDAEKGIVNPGGVCYRVRIEDYDDEFSVEDRFTKFATDARASEVTEFIIGIWDFEMGGSESIRDTIIKHAPTLQNVEAIMFGDITYEENEISWIENSNLTKLIMGFPKLTEIRIRGANGLSVRGLKHPMLKKFTIESGGMSSSIITEVINADMPELEHLELWLGTEDYGFDADVHQLRPILTGSRFPKLKYLGLRDSVIADKIAIALGVAESTDTSAIEIEGKNFVLTGTLQNMTRNDAKKKLQERGAKVGSGVTKTTDYLVAGDKAGSKLEKAKKLEIPVLTEADLFDLLGDKAEKAVSDAGGSVLDNLQVLDLSMGALGDDGAKALFENPKIKNLDKLDLHYHYISDEWVEKLKTLDLVIDTSDQQDDGGDPEDRYVSVSE